MSHAQQAPWDCFCARFVRFLGSESVVSPVSGDQPDTRCLQQRAGARRPV